MVSTFGVLNFVFSYLGDNIGGANCYAAIVLGIKLVT